MAKSKEEAKLFSEELSEMIEAFENAKRDYAWSYGQVGELDKLTQDYLHKLELDDLTYSERAKVATRLANVRRSRRTHKDNVALLEPLVRYLESDKGKTMLNLLREALGATRKAEEKMQHRVYWPRVLKEEKIGEREV